MSEAEFSVVTLHNHISLIEETAALLNTQWPRSLEARKHSIQHSTDTLPCSLILINAGGGVCGYVRMLQVNGKPDSVLVESLLVAKEMRGRGLGRLLMTAVENRARRQGYKTVHLSTHDQHAFYQHIGYTRGSSVDAIKMCNTAISGPLKDEEVPNTSDNGSDSATSDSQSTMPSVSIAPPPPSNVPPPSSSAPPPPPPPPVKLIEIDENMMLRWYIKHL